MTWPWPDDRFERRSRVARMYRDALKDERPDVCSQLDEVMVAYGQTWILDTPDTPPDTMLTTAEVAAWADVSKRTVEKWVERGHLERRVNADKQVVFLMADLIEFQRRRNTPRSA